MRARGHGVWNLNEVVENELVLLKTPTAQLAVNGGSQHPDKRRSGGHGATLADEVEFLLAPAVVTPEGALLPTLAGEGGEEDEIDAEEFRLLPTPITSDGTGGPKNIEGATFAPQLREIGQLLPTPTVAAADGGQRSRSGARSDELLLPGVAAAITEASAWGPFAPAIRRWERVTGRPAPAPTVGDGKRGAHRLSARFAEWMMGLPDGWVTDPAIGLTRKEQIKALGNGVVPQQAEAGIRILLARVAARVRGEA